VLQGVLQESLPAADPTGVAAVQVKERVLVRRLTSDELAARSGEWNEVVAESRRPNPFQLAKCVLAWFETVGDRAELVALAAERDGRLAAVLALAIVRRGPLRRLEPIAGADSPPFDVHAGPDDVDLARRLVQELQTLGFDYAQLPALDAAGALADPAAGLAPIERLAGPVVALEPGAGASPRLLSRNERKSLERRTRRLEELGDLRVETGDTPDLLEELLALHDRRWLGGNDASSFSTVEGRSFHRRVVGVLSGTGIVRSTAVRLGTRLLAFQYAFLIGRSLVCLRIAHDPEFGRYSPGTIALMAAIEDAALNGASRVELLGHQEDSKLRLASGFEPMSWGIGWGQSIRGRVACRPDRAVVRARIALRDRRGRGAR
jgi:CelD/BcsL family acetyltransferase involved in cellulose biosynthesis